jgi:hypothetical protein
MPELSNLGISLGNLLLQTTIKQWVNKRAKIN